MNLRIAQWAAPTIGFAHGFANGAALGILQHMDIVVAAKGTMFSFPEITYHLPPSLVARIASYFACSAASASKSASSSA